MSRPEDKEGRSEYLWIYGPAVLLAVAALVVTYQFVNPAPPDRITIATGDPGGAYYAYAQRYREILARDGVELEVRATAGSLENIALLESGDAEVALVQGGTGRAARSDRLRSLASLYYEPLWLFHRRALEIGDFSDLDGLRVAVGPEGSGSRAVALELLADNKLGEGDVRISELGGERAWQALEAGELDALLVVASPTSSHVQRALRTDNVKLMSFTRAEAYTRLHQYLSKQVLPQGVSDLRRNLPSRDVTLLAPTANLVDRLLVMLLPLVALVIPLMRIMPPLYRWRVRSRVYRWYKELRALEREIRTGVSDAEQDDYLTRLDRIEAEVRKVSIPWSYADELYQLRVHIQYVKETVRSLAAGEAGDTSLPTPPGIQ